MASVSPRVWKGSPRPARSACPRTPIVRSRAGSISRSPISARKSSRISPSRSGSIRLKSASLPRRSPRRPQRPKNPRRGRASRWSSCRSPISEATRSRSISSTGLRKASTDLSRIRGAVVIARNTAFTYKGKPLDVKSIGRDLNVRYVLEGSVQRGGNRMRVNVQLIDAETGSPLWAERFDKPLADLFDMQDEIVARLAGALNTELAAVEARYAREAPNPDSMDLFFQGLSCVHRGRTPNHVAQGRVFFDRALSVDPDNVDALVGSATV